ncbi:unnamed protein product [Brachionus calyciflorus]|uniref:Uncharacterized protein n=1 Tax=Brachionus calyciflorus TaxID=104777 RepID=A0A813MIW7_9BILA|nr:unnamed protein product [Brachionus calyciflorus]
MFKTKSELDKHVGKILMRARSDSDKNKEGLKISRLYYDLKDYESADFYLTNYLSEFSMDAFAWKLKAEICELKEKNWSKAIEFYTRSFKLSDETDSKLLLKICNCLNQVEKFDPIRAKEWIDKTVKVFPYEKTVIDLKEKLFDLVEDLSDKELNEWEIFLTKALSENYMNQELHLKYLRINLKSKNYSNAIKYLIKIEYKSLFQRDLNNSTLWYNRVIDLFEEFIQNESFFNQLDNNGKMLFYLVIINLMTNKFLSLIQQAYDKPMLANHFLKLDKYFSKFEAEKFHLNNQIDQNIYNELVSQYFYLLGLLSLKKETNRTELDKTISETDIEKEQNAGLYCFVKSANTSKANNSFLNQDNSSMTKNNPILNVLLNDYLKLLHRDSCWRYSVIGNWIKFTISKNFSNDFSQFFNSIKSFSKNDQAKNYIVNVLDVSNELDSLFFNKYDQFFDLNDSLSDPYDASALDYADKHCLENQSFNLKYLLWHGIMNTKFSDKCGELTEIPPYFFFQSVKNLPNQDVRFGVENLNICNLESLCLMDLKIFYYSTYYQALSLLSSSRPTTQLRPYWLESNSLSNNNQSEWWYYSTQSIYGSNRNFFESPLDELSFKLNIDSKKKNELAKIIELIRLKSQTVSLTGSKLEPKYKQNINISISIAKYLQFLNDCIEGLNLADKSPQLEADKIQENFAKTLASNTESNHSPRDKQSYLKHYLIKYWTYVLKELIKLKQVSSIDINTNESICESSILNESTMTLNSTTNQQFSSYENYFNSYEIATYKSPCKFMPKNDSAVKLVSSKTSSFDSQDMNNLNKYDSIIQSAQLNLILIYTQPDDQVDFMHTFQNLDEAIGIYRLVEEKLGDKWRNELSFYHLQICKRLGETLVLQRDTLEAIKLKDLDLFKRQKMYEKLDKIQTLIEFTKRKINIGFNKSLTGDLMIQSDRLKQSINASFETSLPYEQTELLANISISETIRDIDKYFTERAENTPEALQKKAEMEEQQRLEEEQRLKEEQEREEQRLREEQEKEEKRLREQREREEQERIERERKQEEERKRIELEEKLKKQREEEEEKRKKEWEVKKRQELEEKNKLLKEIQVQQERIKKLEQDEFLRWTKQKEEIEKEKDRLKCELTEEMNRKLQEIQIKTEQDQVDSADKGRKITDLINTLTKQRTQHFEMNKETLKEQFSFIKNQNTKIKNELRQIKNCTNNRVKMLTEFNQIVKNLNEICDTKIFNAQFSIFYWLFQQNPNLAQVLWHQQNIMNEITKSQEVKKNLDQKQQVKTPAKNQGTMNETSFLSVNEFQTPGEDKSKIANKTTSFLEKPIGDIKFPTNLNVMDQLKKSADAYNLSQQSLEYDEDGEEDEYDEEDGDYYDEDEEYDEEEYDEEEEYEEENYDYNNKSENQTKQETFLSCEDYDISKSEASKQSVNELQILFYQTSSHLYTYDLDKRQWVPKGKCEIQLIGDEISQKGNFQAHIICTLIDDKKTYQYDLTRLTNINDFDNSPNAVYLFESKKNGNSQNISIGIKFDSEQLKNDFKIVCEDCKNKMLNNNSNFKQEGRFSNSFISPSSILPDELPVDRFEKQITLNFDGKFNYPSVVLNLTPIDKVYILTIKQNETIILKHIISSDQKYEINEKQKLHQFVFKYKVTQDQIRIDKITNKSSNETSEHDICLTFSSKPALNEFINVLNLKK